RGGLERLRADHHPNPKNDRHAGIDRNRPRDPRECAREADDRDEGAVQDGVACARAERLPAGMSDVDRGRKGRPEERCRDAADAGWAPTGAMPIAQESSVPSPTATIPPGIRPLNRTRPK